MRKNHKGSLVAIMLIFIVAILMIGYSGWNAVSMHRSSREDTREYVGQVTEQISYTVNTDIDDHKTIVSSIAGSVEMMLTDQIDDTSKNSYLRKFLKEKQSVVQMDYLVLMLDDREDIIVGTLPEVIKEKLSQDADRYERLDAVADAVSQNKSIAYIEEGTVIYAVPVCVNGEIVGAVFGGSSHADMLQMIAVQAYRDVSHSCIVTRTGKLLLSTDEQQFEKLQEILESDSADAAQKQAGIDIQTALQSGETGIAEIECTDGTRYYLSYAPLTGEDWMMLTLIPTTLFSDMYTVYMTKLLVCAAGAALTLLVLLAILVLTYRSSEKKLEKLAFTDKLTDGINITEFDMRFQQAGLADKHFQYAIVMLDIHDFKLLNESVGFTRGDRILKWVYRKIAEELNAKRTEFVARSEMDHYFLCLNEGTRQGIQDRIDRITYRINADDFWKKYAMRIEFSQGACIVADSETDVSTLRERARIACRNQDYSSIGRCVIFEKKMEDKVLLDRNLDHCVEESIQNRDFKLYLQPKVSMRTGIVKGAEALVRWQHPERGFLSPGEFIPILEESGKIQMVDRFIFEEVCRWLQERKRAGKALFPISVNLSRTHFWRENFLDEFVEVVDRYGVDHELIDFELTETVFMEETKMQKVKEGISRMHAYGFRCSVDDFGVGYSSLSLVNEMDVDILKFDRSFFLNLQDEKSQKIVGCLIRMANELKLGMVIEGIEEQEQIDFLMTMPCDIIQGYYFSKPLPEKAFNEWVDARG